MTIDKEPKTHLLDIVKKNQYGELSLDIVGPNIIWLDISAPEKDISISILITDKDKKISRILLGEAPIPNGAWLSVFNNKLIVDKTIVIRTSENASVMFSIDPRRN